jgi:nucleotide-binding universal stress UspA family protein
LVTIPDDRDTTVRGSRKVDMYDVVVVGSDNSVTALRAVEVATALTRMSGGTLHIVTASSDDVVVDSVESESQGVPTFLHTAKGAPADVLIQKADELNADLLVVGNKGMKGARRLLGSVPNSVAHGANCSVMIIDTTE